ncbi:MAG: NYN domain-containing protein [Clostridia bacterium]|nr:NYN domain-containing protein [Clostridia bacterium]
MKRVENGPRRRILIVDGYNVINVRKPVRESIVLEDARRKLTDKLHDYAGWSGQQIILVYDAWLSDRMQRSIEERGSLRVVFTMKGETADCYIERLCDELEDDISMRRAQVRVATSDSIEQTIAFGRGAERLSSRELLLEMDMASRERGPSTGSTGKRVSTVEDRLPADIRLKLEQMRKG